VPAGETLALAPEPLAILGRLRRPRHAMRRVPSAVVPEAAGTLARLASRAEPDDRVRPLLGAPQKGSDDPVEAGQRGRDARRVRPARVHRVHDHPGPGELVEQFFAQRIFGPMRLDKLAKQLDSHDRKQRKHGQLAATRLRQQITDTDRKLKLQVQALEDGVDPDLVQARITELKADQASYQAALAESTPTSSATRPTTSKPAWTASQTSRTRSGTPTRRSSANCSRPSTSRSRRQR
jgi:hypothetical protein